jgi:F0F1-type ATP synthase, gamma subunit
MAKLRPVQNQLLSFKQYVLKTQNLLNNLLASTDIANSFTEERKDKQKIALCLITSDTGLCGSYNNNIIRAAASFINSYGKEKIELICIGRKGLNYFKRREMKIADSFIDLHGRYSEETGAKILGSLAENFLSGKVGEVYVAYTHFESASRHNPVIEKFLNLGTEISEKTEYLFEPDANTMVNELIPFYLSNKMKLILLESFRFRAFFQDYGNGRSNRECKGIAGEDNHHKK